MDLSLRKAVGNMALWLGRLGRTGWLGSSAGWGRTDKTQKMMTLTRDTGQGNSQEMPKKGGCTIAVGYTVSSKAGSFGQV